MRMLARLVIAATLAGDVMAIGCKREVQAKQPAAPAPAPFRVQISGVHFVDDEAVECIEMTATSDASSLSGRSVGDRAKAERLVVDALSERLKSNGVVPIGETCGKQFSGRPLFASCGLPMAKEGPLSISIDSYYLSFDLAFASDKNMKDCISAKGEWKEMSRKSNEFIEAKLHQDSKMLQRLAGVRQ